MRLLVSVLMTAYNREKYIAEAIESVMASTYQDWELIIVDDCSQDRSLTLAQEYASKDDRIKVFQNKKNLGDYPNRNQAASYAQGKYLKYLDADDIIYPHSLEVMVKAMDKYPYAGFGTQINIREYIVPYPFQISQHDAYKRHFLEGGLFFSGPTGTIIKRETFERVGGFSGKRHIGDTELWLKMSALSPVVCFQPSLIWWRQHPEQEMGKELENPNIPVVRYDLNIEMLKRSECPLSPEDIKIAILNQKKVYARKILAGLFRNPNLARCLFRSKMFRCYDIFKAFYC